MDLQAALDRVASARPGYTMASFKEAALPVFLVTARVLTLEKKELSPIEEGCLRAIDVGLTSPAQICEFLGLPPAVLNGVLAGLNARECIAYVRAQGAEQATVSLTVKGKSALADAVQVVPNERLIRLVYDPLLQRIHLADPESLWKPREVKDIGWFEVPTCGRHAPELGDIPLQQLDKVVSRIGDDQQFELLALRRLERRELRFLPCLLIYYKSTNGKDVQVAFFRDEVISTEHENAFRALGGPRLVGSLLVKAPPRQPEFSSQIVQDEAKLVSHDDPGTKDAIVKVPTLRMLRCHEHPVYLMKALKETERRLLIVSPWIKDQVVDAQFLRLLETLLRSGVEVFIGYGLVEETGKAGKDADRQKQAISKGAKEALERLHQRHKNLVWKFVGNTHRKLLVSDSKFAISTSFNWLSFRGDPQMKPRDEAGILVTKGEYVEEVFIDGIDLLTHGYAHPKSGQEKGDTETFN